MGICMRKVSYLRYAAGILGLSLVSQLFHSYNYSYYVDELGMAITLATLSKVIFIGFDAINDIFLGRLSDRTNTKRGKRTPWLIHGAPYFGVALILAFLPNPSFSPILAIVQKPCGSIKILPSLHSFEPTFL
jgi:GPH family glycoside/pentoside/hexuronide:cation symporter